MQATQSIQTLNDYCKCQMMYFNTKNVMRIKINKVRY